VARAEPHKHGVHARRCVIEHCTVAIDHANIDAVSVEYGGPRTGWGIEIRCVGVGVALVEHRCDDPDLAVTCTGGLDEVGTINAVRARELFADKLGQRRRGHSCWRPCWCPESECIKPPATLDALSTKLRTEELEVRANVRGIAVSAVALVAGVDPGVAESSEGGLLKGVVQ
jgi:hypothetical protein